MEPVDNSILGFNGLYSKNNVLSLTDEINGIGDTQAAWAAVMRPVYTNNFEKEHIQYLPFWLMDPFYWALGFGYRTRNLKFLTWRADQIATKRDQTEIRAQADYNFGNRRNLRLYYNQNVTKYAISTAFPVSDIQFGLSARVNFGS